MHRFFFGLFIVLPLMPLANAFLQTRSFLEADREAQLTSQRQFILDATAGLSEPLLTRPNLSPTELFELGRRIDALREIDSLVLLHRFSEDGAQPRLGLVYATPGVSVTESSNWDEVLSPLVTNAEAAAEERLGEIPRRLGELGLEIVNVVVEGGDGTTSSLQRLDREFKRLYEEGNARLSRLSRSLQQAVNIPIGPTARTTTVYLAQPVLSFARSRRAEVIGVVLIRIEESEPGSPESAFFLRLGSSLLLAFTLFLLGMVITRWKNAPWNRV